MKCITLPAGPSAASQEATTDDGFKLGLMRVALHATARAAELEAECADSYDVVTRGARSALEALGSRLRLPSELEKLR